MWNPNQFRDLVSGRRRGLGAAALRGCLRAVETPYGWAVRYRNRRFDRCPSLTSRVPAVVVSVGNLTLGGTGKTPMVAWLARWFAERAVRVALVSRGYGSVPGQGNDEALELARQLPGVPHLQNPDRVEAARQALRQFRSEVIILDDGFQHRRLARDLDIVLIDALEPFGFGHLFPRGTLREPPAGLSRADVLALSRADLITASQRRSLRRQAERWAPGAAWCEVVHRPSHLEAADGQRRELGQLAGQRLAAFCGLGNPAGFRRTLAACGGRVVAFQAFPDHHRYEERDRRQIDQWADRCRADMIVCTRKDLVKIDRTMLGARPVWAVAVELAVTAGLEPLVAALERATARRQAA